MNGDMRREVSCRALWYVAGALLLVLGCITCYIYGGNYVKVLSDFSINVGVVATKALFATLRFGVFRGVIEVIIGLGLLFRKEVFK